MRTSKSLLISPAHSDHRAGSAEILRDTKARHLVMEGDANAVENCGAKKLPSGAPAYTQFSPAHVDEKLERQKAKQFRPDVRRLTAGVNRFTADTFRAVHQKAWPSFEEQGAPLSRCK